MNNALTKEDLQLNMKIVLFDQDGRMNPSFHVITKITPQFVYIIRLGSTSVDKYPEEKIPPCGYRSSTTNIETPTTEEVGVPVKKKINKLRKSNIYDPNKEYLARWYD